MVYQKAHFCDGISMAENDGVLNDPNVIRCMFFVKEVLEAVGRNGGVISPQKIRNGQGSESIKEAFPMEILKELCYETDKSIVNFLTQLHLPAEGRNIRRIALQRITNWLKVAGYLMEEYHEKVGRLSTVPTEKGRKLGIYSEIRAFNGNTYLAVIYNQNAQEFLVQNMEAIMNGEVVE